MRVISLLSSLLSLILIASVSSAPSSSARTSSPVTNWDSAWTASSLQGTVIVLPCQTESTEPQHATTKALLVLLPPWSSSSSLPSFTILDNAFVAWTGFAVDVECLTNQLLQHADDHISIYNQGPGNVATFLASRVRREAINGSGRPLAVQALVIQRQCVWTIDLSGACTLWNAGATAMGKDAADVRKLLHAALQAQAAVPSVSQALRMALHVLPKQNDSTRIKNDVPRAFLLCQGRERTSLSVQTLDSKVIREQLRELSSDDDDTSKE